MFYVEIKKRRNKLQDKFSFHGKVFSLLHLFLSANDEVNIGIDIDRGEMRLFSVEKESLYQFRDLFLSDSPEGDYITALEEFLAEREDLASYVERVLTTFDFDNVVFSGVRKVDERKVASYFYMKRKRSRQDKFNRKKIENQILYILKNSDKEFGILKTKISKLLKVNGIFTLEDFSKYDKKDKLYQDLYNRLSSADQYLYIREVLFSNDLGTKREGKGLLFVDKVDVNDSDCVNFKTNRYGLSSQENLFLIPRMV